jgi:steroid delta-isomerase-like uncharacterized protein
VALAPETGTRPSIAVSLRRKRKDLDAVGALLTDDFVAHFGEPRLDRAAYFQFVRAFHVGFPDLRNTIEQQLGQGDLVASRTVWTGTHRGEFLGVPATGKQVRFEALSLSRTSGGKIAEHWFIGDMLSVLQQLGDPYGWAGRLICTKLLKAVRCSTCRVAIATTGTISIRTASQTCLTRKTRTTATTATSSRSR